MSKVVTSPVWSRDNSGAGRNTGGQEPPGDDQLEKRVERLETAMADVQVRLIRVESKLDQVATKADLSDLKGDLFKAMNEQTWKFVAAATGMSALFATIAFGLARALNG